MGASLAKAALLVMALGVLLAAGSIHKREAASAAGPTQATQTAQARTQPTPADGVRRVTVEELRAALEKGSAVVVDVRGADQYRAGHIKGALSIPEEELARRVKELPTDKLIVTYCS